MTLYIVILSGNSNSFVVVLLGILVCVSTYNYTKQNFLIIDTLHPPISFLNLRITQYQLLLRRQLPAVLSCGLPFSWESHVVECYDKWYFYFDFRGGKCIPITFWGHCLGMLFMNKWAPTGGDHYRLTFHALFVSLSVWEKDPTQPIVIMIIDQ